MSKETKELVLEMCVGIVGFNLIMGLLAAVICPRMGYQAGSILLGLLLGAVGAIGMLTHMAVITERVLDTHDEGYANRTTIIHSVARKLIFMAVLVLVILKVPQINALAIVVGAMGMKAGAYLQPIVHRLRRRKAC